MHKIKVLIVDDSALVRKIISDSISNHADIELVGTAGNGLMALSKIDRFKPDVVTLDIEMPVMNGLKAMKEIHKRWPHVQVVMFSTLSEQGAHATMEALALGAADYLAKPAGMRGGPREAKKWISDRLTPKILSLGKRARRQSLRTRTTPASNTNLRSVKDQQVPKVAQAPGNTPSTLAKTTKLRQSNIDAVSIGISTGGPNALNKLITDFPKNFPVPVFITQHMPPVFTKILAERLNNSSNLEVVEAKEGMIVKPGFAYLAPGGFHMTISKRGNQATVRLNQDDPVCFSRPSVDVMFTSIAESYGGNVLAVIMTGMGKDGCDGCKTLAKKGAYIMIQDAATSIVWGMPGAVSKAGLHNEEHSLENMGKAIVNRVGGSISLRKSA